MTVLQGATANRCFNEYKTQGFMSEDISRSLKNVNLDPASMAISFQNVINQEGGEKGSSL